MCETKELRILNGIVKYSSLKDMNILVSNIYIKLHSYELSYSI